MKNVGSQINKGLYTLYQLDNQPLELKYLNCHVKLCKTAKCFLPFPFKYRVLTVHCDMK